MSRPNSFDVIKRMCLENLDIRLAPPENIVNLRKTKAGTQVTIGVSGDVVGAIYSGEMTGFFLYYNVKQFQELQAKMAEESDQS